MKKLFFITKVYDIYGIVLHSCYNAGFLTSKYYLKAPLYCFGQSKSKFLIFAYNTKYGFLKVPLPTATKSALSFDIISSTMLTSVINPTAIVGMLHFTLIMLE